NEIAELTLVDGSVFLLCIACWAHSAVKASAGFVAGECPCTARAVAVAPAHTADAPHECAVWFLHRLVSFYLVMCWPFAMPCSSRRAIRSWSWGCQKSTWIRCTCRSASSHCCCAADGR